jgi:hypothetical protein
MGGLALGADAVRPLPALARITGRDVLTEGYEEIAPDRPLQILRPGFGREAARVALPNDPAMFKHVDAVGVG